MMIKVCSVCEKEKSLEDFHKRKAGKDGHQGRCKECNNASRLEYYYGDKARHRIYNNERRRGLKDRINILKESSGCKDCGETDYVVLDFDHITDNKVMNVSSMVTAGCGWERILEEVQKCEVVCSNCHRRRTHKRLHESNSKAEIHSYMVEVAGSTPVSRNNE